MQDVQMTELEELEIIYCELHKDVYGVKARWYQAKSIEQARKDLESLEAAGKEIWAREEQERQEAVKRFEARVQQVIESGAKDRETALRWIHQAEDTDGDDEYLCYKLNLPYAYFKKAA